MAGKVLDIDEIMGVDWLADYIANQYTQWDSYRRPWLKEKSELRDYIYATDTRKTSNSNLPWKNSTTLPKLTQIHDNLIANYFAALFPNEDWLDYESNEEEDEEQIERVKEYMKAKLAEQNFEDIVIEFLQDYVQAGNAIGTTGFENNVTINEKGEKTTSYSGPKAYRLSPYDIVFNPLSDTFENSPKIVRSVLSIGEIVKRSENEPYMADMFSIVKDRRKAFAEFSTSDNLKGRHMSIDGFGDIRSYYSSQLVEVLEFYGDYYNVQTGELKTNMIVTIVDRSKVVREIVNPSWNGTSKIKHTGWRTRPDNLYAMGPLDNLVGMQYRIDHLENLRADAFDMIAFPMIKVSGQVDDFEYGPGNRIFTSEDGDVGFMSPDVTVLQADTQIAIIENRMEEMAGAPRQAMGIRTPGEKTKYEVQTLENAAGRVFQHKAAHFERTFLEKLLNDMLEEARRNMDGSETIKVIDSDLGVAVLKTITKEDLTVKGKLKPKGAQHFAKKANQLQNLTNFANSSLGQDPAINSHISGLKIAKMVEDLLEVKKYDLVNKNIRISEEMDRQRMISAGENVLAEEGALPVTQEVSQ